MRKLRVTSILIFVARKADWATLHLEHSCIWFKHIYFQNVYMYNTYKNTTIGLERKHKSLFSSFFLKMWSLSEIWVYE